MLIIGPGDRGGPNERSGDMPLGHVEPQAAEGKGAALGDVFSILLERLCRFEAGAE
jgi:hypothetical protein